MHEYVMPVARRSALRRRGRRPAGTTRRRAHGATPPNGGATRQARAGPPADTDYRRQSRPQRPTRRRRPPRRPFGSPAMSSHARRAAARDCRILATVGQASLDARRATAASAASHARARDATPRRPGRRRANAPLADGVRPNGPRLRAIGAITIARAAWKINSYDRMSRRKAAPAGARHGDGTQRAARSRISTRGAPMRRARRRPARPASPGRETLIATE
ncbi:hypothetical protein BBMA_165 [Burkholderia pseudomallei MSHR1079]|nr:hypothetical protein X882_5236 [Burkholderia pseudomallei MSHR4303]KKB67175.1 hypothetical protein BBMA_165 [Burkholderia pseudomallei MSHR1079]